jgi:anti-anti-sigma factor
MTDVVVRLTGEFDMSNAQAIVDRVAQATMGHEGATMIVDLEDVTFMDAAGVRALLKAQRQTVRAGSAMVVRRPLPLIADMLTILGVADQLFGTAPVPPPRAVERGGRGAGPGAAGAPAG